jgi:hypothetical protein
MTLATGTAFIQAPGKLFQGLGIDGVAIEEGSIDAVLGLQHLPEIFNLFSGGDRFPLILLIDRTPCDALSTIRACIKFHQPKSIDVMDGKLGQIQ